MPFAVRMKKQPIVAPKGTFDILPQDFPYWDRLEEAIKKVAASYGFKRIETPIIEHTDLFVRGVGNFTDIVGKEMYSFKTKGDDELSLRPEGTAPVIRAYIQNGMDNMPRPVKLFYVGPMFRHENPQAGRFREFHQFGIEAIGSSNPVLDAQAIKMFFSLMEELKLKNKFFVKVNSIGDRTCRPKYISALKSYYKSQQGKLCPDCRKKIATNPLRIFDCKNEKCTRISLQAPNILDYLCDECNAHFKQVLDYLDELGVTYLLDTKLARGLDYYTKTVFEFYPEANSAEGGKTNALGGGGRYDYLVELLGGKPVPALGMAIGLERIIGLMKQEKVKLAMPKEERVFLIQLGDMARKKSLGIFEELRKNKIMVEEAFSKDSIKAQLKTAAKNGANIALILGQKEAIDDNIIVRDMQSGIQETIPLHKLLGELKKRFKEQAA